MKSIWVRVTEVKIVVDINHPAHVHYFKHFIWEMERRGHEILITASSKEMSLALLRNYKFNFINLGSYGNSLPEKCINLPFMDLKLYKAVKSFNPDIFIGFSSARAAHVSTLMRKPCINFDDTEHARWEHKLYAPFTDTIVTPTCFRKDFGKKQIRYSGYIELAHLHPKYLTPNPAVMAEIGLSKLDTFIILRFVSWRAVHDVRQHGVIDKAAFVRGLEIYGRVLISAECILPKELEKYRITVSPEKLHDLLYYASLYIGEGATTATESALLGTPSIYISSLIGQMGNFIELEQKYGLIFNYNDSNKAINKAIELIQKPNLKEEWKKKREKLLRDNIDVTAFMVWFIERYPESVKEIREKPGIQESFYDLV